MYINPLMSLVKDIPGAGRILPEVLNVISQNIPGLLVILHMLLLATSKHASFLILF
jgi:hypothetical protein